MDWLRQALPESVRPLMLGASTVGHPTVIIIALCLVGLIGWRLNDMHIVLGVGLALATMGINTILKLCLRRERPATDYARTMRLASFSFPSGHAACAAAGLGYLAYAGVGQWPEWGALFYLVAAVTTGIIGVSRIYLGAHYPSDVAGGWIVGATGLLTILYLV